jgi:carboxymethylenebutenolidase
MGGRVTFLVALELALGAAVGFYGGGIVTGRFPQFPPLVERVDELQTPWLGIFGDLDGSIPVEDVELLRARLGAIDRPTEVLRYATAEHGFHCDVRPSYHAEASTDAWARTLAWFQDHLA